MKKSKQQIKPIDSGVVGDEPVLKERQAENT